MEYILIICLLNLIKVDIFAYKIDHSYAMLTLD